MSARRRDESKCAHQTMSLFGEEPRAETPAGKPPVAPPAALAPVPIPAPAATVPATPAVAAPAQVGGRVEIHFDGGCLGNPGKKYGSFLVRLDGREILRRSRAEFGHGTNNEAEFNALKLGLDEAAAWFAAQGLAPESLTLRVVTDSMIVRNRLAVKNVVFQKFPSSQRMFALANECLAVMRRFGSFEVEWQGRAGNVEKFGH